MKFEIDLKGFNELKGLLNELPLQVERRIVDGAAKAAMRPMLADARNRLSANGSIRTGDLRDSLSRRSRKLRNGMRSTRVGPNSKKVTSRKAASGRVYKYKPAAIAHLVERGTKSHVIKAKRGGALTLHGGAKVPKVNHPGARAQPFMEPAYDRYKNSALKTYGDELFKRSKQWIERKRRV